MVLGGGLTQKEVEAERNPFDLEGSELATKVYFANSALCLVHTQDIPFNPDLGLLESFSFNKFFY
jgi:hypothetical protein